MREATVGWIALVTVTVTLVVTAGGASAQDEYNVGELLAPGFDYGDDAFDDAERTTPAPAAPAIAELRDAWDVVKGVAYGLVAGFEAGDAGTDAGSPDGVVVIVPETVLVDGVEVPGFTISVPGREIVIATPPVVVHRDVPGVYQPPIHVTVDGVTIPVTVPGIGTPPVPVDVPERTLVTPGVGTPPVNVTTPGVRVPADDVTVDHGDLSVEFDGANGTLYLGDEVEQPFEVPGTRERVGDHLPEPVPQNLTVRGGTVDAPERTLVDESGHVLVPSQSVTTPGVHEEVPGTHFTDPVPVGTVETDAHTVFVPGREVLPPRTVHEEVPGVDVLRAETETVEVHADAVPVTDERVVVPGREAGMEQPVPADDFGYFGYGRDDDSSLYPYLCAGDAGCARGSLVRPWVEYADAWADSVTALLDGPITVQPPTR